MADYVSLRAMTLQYADDGIRILTDDSVKKTYMLPDFESREAALKLYLRLCALSQQSDRYVRGIYFNEKLIGFINDPENDGKQIELGWVVHPAYQGRGYCTQAVKAAIAELFHIGYESVTAGAFDGNIASMRVMEKCGMRRIDKTEQIPYRGNVYECIFYKIDKP